MVKASRGTKLATYEAGDRSAPTLFFIHGAAGSSSNWIYQLRALRHRFHVVAFDLRGHGRSNWPGRSNLEEFDRDVDAVLSALGLTDPMVVVAHSFGGCLATRLAHRRGDLVHGLGLFDTAGHLPRGVLYRLLLLFSSRVDRIRNQYPWMVAADARVVSSVLRHTVKEWDCWDLFPLLTMPTLVMAGALDVLIPASLSRRMADSLPHSTFEVVAGAGHVLSVERPELVTEEIQDFALRCLDSHSNRK